MKNKDQILLEAAYNKISNIQNFDYSKLNYDDLDEDDLKSIALKNPSIIRDMKNYLLDLIDSMSFTDNPTEDDIRQLSPEETVYDTKVHVEGGLKGFFQSSM